MRDGADDKDVGAQPTGQDIGTRPAVMVSSSDEPVIVSLPEVPVYEPETLVTVTAMAWVSVLLPSETCTVDVVDVVAAGVGRVSKSGAETKPARRSWR